MTAYYYNTNTHNTHKMYSFSRSSLLKPEIISNVYVLHCVSLSAFASLEYLSTNVLLTIILIIILITYITMLVFCRLDLIGVVLPALVFSLCICVQLT